MERPPRRFGTFAPAGAVIGVVLGAALGLWMTGAYNEQCSRFSLCSHGPKPLVGIIAGAIVGLLVGVLAGSCFRREL